ncbi:MAG: hypothetical protein ACLUBJ_04320 [Veillonella atypica]|uniref:hypothetical protein n=1 Tax=Veillonella atypica TaxID=39777 RepID=UPI0039929477
MHWFVKFLFIIFGIWASLVVIKPTRFAPPCLQKWPFIKLICIFFIISIPLLILNESLLSPEEKAAIQADQQQSNRERELKENIYANSLGLTTLEEANAIKSILDSLDITNPTSIDHDNDLDDNSNGTKGYRISANERKHIILYMNPNNTVQSIRYQDIYLYANNAIIQKLSDVSLSSDQQLYMKDTVEKAIKSILKAPKTAEFSRTKDTHYSIKDGIATIQGYVDAQNSFGVQIRNPYYAEFDAKNNMKIIHLTFNGNTVF